MREHEHGERAILPLRRCRCAEPAPEERGTHKGATRKVCARCGRPLPLRLGRGPAWV